MHKLLVCLNDYLKHAVTDPPANVSTSTEYLGLLILELISGNIVPCIRFSLL